TRTMASHSGCHDPAFLIGGRTTRSAIAARGRGVGGERVLVAAAPVRDIAESPLRLDRNSRREWLRQPHGSRAGACDAATGRAGGADRPGRKSLPPDSAAARRG